MKNRTIGLALVLGVAMGATSAQAAAVVCDRACLRGVMTGYLAALVARDPAKAPVAANVRFTEDAKDAKLGEGLWKTATGLGTYRQDFIDPRLGVAGTHVVVMEGDKPALVAVRLKVVGGKMVAVEAFLKYAPLASGSGWE